MIGEGTIIYHPELSTILDGVEIGNLCVIHSHVWIGKNVKIGNQVKIQAFTFIPEGVVIEDKVFIGPHVVFTNDPKLMVSGKEFWKPTLVKVGARIGANASILAGVTIGKGAVVGMGAVVVHDVPDGATVVGNPAGCVKRCPLCNKRVIELNSSL